MSPSSVSSGERDSQSSEWQFFCFHEVPAFVQSSSVSRALAANCVWFCVAAAAGGPQRDAAGHAERMASASAVTSAPSAEDGLCTHAGAPWEVLLHAGRLLDPPGMPVATRRGNITQRMPRVATRRHSEFSLGTYAKGQDEWDAAKRLYSQRYTVGTEGRGTLVRLCVRRAVGRRTASRSSTSRNPSST